MTYGQNNALLLVLICSVIRKDKIIIAYNLRRNLSYSLDINDRGTRDPMPPTWQYDGTPYLPSTGSSYGTQVARMKPWEKPGGKV